MQDFELSFNLAAQYPLNIPCFSNTCFTNMEIQQKPTHRVSNFSRTEIFLRDLSFHEHDEDEVKNVDSGGQSIALFWALKSLGLHV